MTEKITIRIGMSSKIDVWRDGEWTILYTEDGSGAKTTVSLGTLQALNLASLLRAHGISSAFATCDCGAETEGKWADIHHPSCGALKADTIKEEPR